MLCNYRLLIYLSYMVYDAIKNNPMKEQELNKNHLLPVHMVSVYHKKGKSDPSDMYSGGGVLIDHVSGYMSIKHQVDIKATENFKAKITFDR